MEKPKMTIGVQSKMFEEILEDFDFEKAHAIIVLLDITFPDYIGSTERHTPTVDELKVTAHACLEKAWIDRMKWDEVDEEHKVAGVYDWCGHLYVDILEDSFDLQFIPIQASSFFEDHQE